MEIGCWMKQLPLEEEVHHRNTESTEAEADELTARFSVPSVAPWRTQITKLWGGALAPRAFEELTDCAWGRAPPYRRSADASAAARRP